LWIVESNSCYVAERFHDQHGVAARSASATSGRRLRLWTRPGRIAPAAPETVDRHDRRDHG
jgi:hypothetical protein